MDDSNPNLARARTLASEGRNAEALALFKGFRDAWPDDPQVLYGLGLCLAAAGDAKGAMSALSDSLRLGGDRSDALSALGALYLDEGLLKAAAPLLKRAVELDSMNGKAWNNYGVLAFLSADYAKARSRFERALRLMPEDYDAWFNLRDACEAYGDEEGRLKAASALDRLDKQRGLGE